MSNNKFFNYINIIRKVEGLNPVNACIRCKSFDGDKGHCNKLDKETQAYNCCDLFNPIKLNILQFPIKGESK